MRGDARLLQARAAAGDLAGFRLRAVVKETGVDDAGLREFATEYFPHPTYKDKDLAFYKALGAGKLSLGYNPLAMLQFIRQSLKRIKDLGIESYNTKGARLARAPRVRDTRPRPLTPLSSAGEGFLQGGWILCDREGIPRAAFRENAKQRLPVDDIVAAARAMAQAQARAGDGGGVEKG